jgi:SAM-dependent methyltransferase
MKPLYSIKTADIIKQYKELGVDITRIIGNAEVFELIEEENGLRRWVPPITGDSQFYDELAKNNSWYYLPDKKEYNIALQYIDRGPVLEVGCGEGYFALKGNLPSYIGLELNEEAAKKAISKGLNVIIQDFQDFADENPSTISCVCSFQVLEHLKSPESFFQSSYTVLKENGLMITAVPAEDSFAGTIQNNCLNAPPHHITRWTDKCLKELPRNNGFECIDIIHIPVEQIHAQWFWSTLLDRAKSQKAKGSGIKEKIKWKVLLKLAVSMGITSHVPEDFHIPGHTVIAVHKKA